MKPIFINFPENTNQTINENSNHTYNCTIASSNRTTVQWVSSRGPIPECVSDAWSCNNSNCFVENQPCVTSSVTVTEELFLVHSLILYLYSASGNHSDQYTCRVQGLDEQVVRRHNLTIQQSLAVSVNVSTIVRTEGVINNDKNEILIPLVTESVSALILVMLASTIIVIVKLYCYIKNRRGRQEGDDGNREIELATTSPTERIAEEDEWEFPREKLKLLQKIGKIAIWQSLCIFVIGTYIRYCRCWKFWPSV